MNKTYKVIYNRTRCMYQVVSELAKGHTKSETPEMLKNLFSKHSGLTRGIVMAVLSMSLAMPVGVAVQAADTTVTVKDGAALVGSGAVSVSSTTSDDKNIITISVPTNGTVGANNTGLVTGGTVYTAITDANTALSNKIGTLDANGNYIQKDASVSSNLSILDTKIKSNAENITNNTSAISAETTARETADTSLTNKIGTLDANGNYIQKDASVSSNFSTLDTQMKTNADAISTETANREKAVSDEATARTNAISALETKLTSGGSNSLVSKANVDASNIGTKIDTSSETTEEAKKKKQEDNAKLWGEALGIGTIADGNEELLTGGTLYTELRPSADGFYIYNGKSTAYNLLALDSAINALGVEKVTDNSGNITYVSNLYKYFKVNPETSTNDDGTVTYATDADAQGTNSVAIGPSAKVNTTGENGVAIGNGATTGADKYTKTLTDKTTTEVSAAGGVDSVAIGTNAASQGNDSVALGKGAQVLNDFDSSTNAAVVKTGDVAIGSGATVDSSLNSTAIGASADVRYGEDSLALGSSAKVDTAKQAVALGYKASVADGADGSLALGDEASAKSSFATAIGYKASANTASSIALGNGANTGGDGGGIAIGTSATADGRSIAIGFSGTTTANNYDSVAIGNGAQANVDRSISIGLNAGTGAKADKGGNEGSLIAIGDAAGQNVAGLQNTAIGSGAGSGVKSSNNIALGSYAGSNITNVSDNNPQNGYNISIGYQANYSKTNQTIIDSLAIGRGTSAITNGVALGATAKASGQNSVSLGFNTQSSGTDSMALGSGASAADGNVAIGSSSAAPAVSTLGTVKDDGNVYKAETSTDSSGAVTTTYTLYKSALTNIPLSSTSHYVSFGISDGNTTVNRRLSNVADGVFDQDAVTVKQLNTAYSSLQGLIKGIDTSTLNTYSTDVIDSKEANLKAEIANSKYKYFSVNADSATSTGNQDNTGASSGGADAMAIGPNAYATATKSLAVGNNVSASGVHSIALGTSDNPTTTAGATTTHYTSSEGENSIAVGYAAIAQTDNSIAIGTRAVTYTADTSSTTPTKTGINSIAIGYETVTRKDYATAIGNSASAEGTESTALGNKTTAVGTESLAVGSQSTTNGDGSASIGRSNAVTGTDVAAVGSGNISSGSWGGITDSGLFGYTNKIQAYSDTNVSNTVTGVYALGSNNAVDQANKINKVTNVTLLGQGNSVAAGSNETSYQNTINNVTVIGGSNTVKGYEQSTTSWSTLENDTVLGYGNTIDASQQATPVSNIQILGNKVTAALGNSVYLGTAAAYVSAAAASNDAETLAVQRGDADAEASDEYKAAATDTERNTIKQKYEAKYLYKARVAAMEASGTTAGVNQYDQDNTYGNASSYTYAGSNPTGVVTVGSVGSERRIQNVAAGLVSATSTDAVNGSQLYALTRQLRFGGDNSTFGTTTADDKEVVARGSNEALSIIGGETDATKLTDNNIGVVSDGKDTLTVKLSKNVDLGTDGSVVTGNTTLDNSGLTIANGPKFTSSGIDVANKKITSVKAGEANADAANYGQVKAAKTILMRGKNTQLSDTTADDGHHIYTVNVDNLSYKAGTNTTAKSVTLSNGLTFQNGKNTTAVAGDNGIITYNLNDKIELGVETDSNNHIVVDGTQGLLTLGMDATINGNAGTASIGGVSIGKSGTDRVITGLTNKTWTVGTTQAVDGRAATENQLQSVAENLNTANTNIATLQHGFKVQANGDTTTESTVKVDDSLNFTAGDNAKVTTTKNSKQITISVDNLSVKDNNGTAHSVKLADGLNFQDGTNTTAKVGTSGTVTYDLKDSITLGNSTDETNRIIVNGTNGTITAGNLATINGNAGTASIGGVSIGKSGSDQTVTGLSNKTWVVGKSTAVNGRAATEDQLQSVSNAAYTNANNITTLQQGFTVTANNDNDKKSTIKAGDKLNFQAGKNVQISTTAESKSIEVAVSDTPEFTTVTAKDANGNITTVSGTGVAITPTGTGTQSVSLTSEGLDNGNHVIKNVASGGTVRTNAANIGDLQDAISNASKTTTNTGFNVKGDDAVAKKVKLGKQLNVVGGTTDSTQLSTGNIGVETTADAEGNATLTVKLNKDINLESVKTGNTTLDNNGVSNGKMSLTGTGMTITDTDASKQVSVTTSGVSMGSQRIQNVADAAQDTDAATLKQVKNARTVVAKGDNVKEVTSSEATDGSHQMTYTVNVDNLSVKANNEAAKSVTLKNGLTFNNGTNTTASVGDTGEVKYDLNSTLTGLTSVTAGNSTLDTNGLTIKDGAATKVEITSGNVTMGGNVIHNVGAGQVGTDAVNKDQLDALQTQVNGGWNLAGNNAEGTAVTAKIGAGKTVTYGDGNYTKFVVTKDDSTGNATVKVDVTTGTFGSGTGDKAGTVTSTAEGLATTGAVANAINSASINVVADNTPKNKTAVKAGDTIHFAKDDNLTLVQNGTTFTYGLNPEISISKVTTSDATKGSTVQTAEGVTTTDAAGNTYIQNGQGITLTPSDKTKPPVKLTNTGLDNGGNKITGVGNGTDDTDAVNVAQLKEVNDKVGSGWQIAGNDGQKVTDIGAGKKVAFKSNSNYLTTSTTARSATGELDTGADVTYSLKTAALASGTDGTVTAVADANDGLVTAKNLATVLNSTYWSAAADASGSGTVSGNAAAASIKAGTKVTFTAGDNMSLTQNGAQFTYTLLPNLTNMNTIRFGGGLLIGNQAGSGANTEEGNYITGLSNTKWDRAKISENSNMAATEGQLKQAIENITTSGGGTGGFGLQADTGDSIMQDLRKTIQIKGDGEGTQDGNIKTSNEGGVLHIRLNKKLNLTDQGSVTIGSSNVSDGRIVLDNTDAAKKITLNSNEGTAAIGGVTVNGAASTVSGLSNTEWNVETAAANGYKGSNKAATESQLQTVYNQATKTASENELHTLAKESGYTVDDNHKVSMDVVNGKGDKQGSIVINDVAKASEVGTVSEIADDLKTKNGDTVQPTSVVEAINNLNDKVGDKKYSTVQGKELADGDSATTAIGKLNNRMNDIYTTAGQHSSVSKADDNLTISENKNASGGTDYKIGLNKEQINLGNLIIKGNEGSISAKSMTSDSFTAGDTVVNKDGVKVGDKSALTGDSLKVNGKTYVDDKGVNANGQVIRNVGEGKEDGDAVNVKQVNDLAARQGEAIEQNTAHINQLGQAVNKLGNRLNRVGAGAAALAALHPGTYDPNDKWDFSAGVGHYHDANAVAIGAYYHPNDTTILSIGGSMGGGENMVNAGITWKMGRSGREQAAQPVVVRKAEAAPVVQQAAPVRTAPVVTPAPVTTPAPVKSVASATPVHALPAVTTPMTQVTTGDTAALAQILAQQTAILEKLAQNQSQAAPSAAVAHGDDIFPDVPDNHWAYAYVAKLEKAGALKGFKRPAVLKSPMMTRDDFASVLYTAMANGATTNPALNGDDSLNRLAQEFKAELKNVKA